MSRCNIVLQSSAGKHVYCTCRIMMKLIHLNLHGKISLHCDINSQICIRYCKGLSWWLENDQRQTETLPRVSSPNDGLVLNHSGCGIV